MGRLMYCEDGKWLIRNYAGRRQYNEIGECARVVEPGELIVLDRSRKPNGELPDLEIHEFPGAAQKKGLVPTWLKEPSEIKAMVIAFLLGMWAVFAALFVASVIN